MQDSGNCYKVRLVLEQLSLAYELEDINILNGESRTDSFFEKNLNGRVPTLELEQGGYLPESNAILFYLADGTPLLPDDRLSKAQALQWMFFEQYSHEPFIATSRFWMSILKQPEVYRKEIAAKKPGGEAALGVMENHLVSNDFFAANTYSIADVALYAYTHVCHQGGFSLEPYPSIRSWIDRVASRPRHVTMDFRP